MKEFSFEINKIQRKFVPGDNWLYFRVFTGIKTADRLLRELIKPATDHFLEKGFIDKWFFIRYRDPHHQLRIRFCLNRSKYISEILELLSEGFRYYIDNDLIWKIQIDTYSRELERYGFENIDLSEKIFFFDSKLILNFLSITGGDESEQLRWLFGIKAIDSFLSDFNLDMSSKLDLITVLRNGFAKEFSEDKYLRKQFEKKFRSQRAAITDFLSELKTKNNIKSKIGKMISERSRDIRIICDEMLKQYNERRSGPGFFDLLGSFLHMMVNRLFRTNQRLHELVLYDFLKRYYTSEIARKKYNKKG